MQNNFSFGGPRVAPIRLIGYCIDNGLEYRYIGNGYYKLSNETVYDAEKNIFVHWYYSDTGNGNIYVPNRTYGGPAPGSNSSNGGPSNPSGRRPTNNSNPSAGGPSNSSAGGPSGASNYNSMLSLLLIGSFLISLLILLIPTISLLLPFAIA